MAAPEKLYVDTTYRLNDLIFYGFAEKHKEDEVEYVRKDAFIEKAEKWFKSHGSFTIGFDGATFGDFLNFINK